MKTPILLLLILFPPLAPLRAWNKESNMLTAIIKLQGQQMMWAGWGLGGM